MKLNLPEKDLLELLDKTPTERRDFFIENKILEVNSWRMGIPNSLESYADLTDRLWKLAVEKCEHFQDSLLTVYVKANKLSLGATVDTQRLLLSSESWFLYRAEPIHRIVAALIALRRAGVTEI